MMPINAHKPFSKKLAALHAQSIVVMFLSSAKASLYNVDCNIFIKGKAINSRNNLKQNEYFRDKYILVLGRTQFVGSEFGIFGGFGWVRSSVLVGKLGFGRVRSSTSRVRSSSKLEVFSKMFIVVGFVGSEFGIFVGFGWVRSSVLVGELGFGRVRSSTSRVRSSSEFVTFGFDPTLIQKYMIILYFRTIFRHFL